MTKEDRDHPTRNYLLTNGQGQTWKDPQHMLWIDGMDCTDFRNSDVLQVDLQTTVIQANHDFKALGGRRKPVNGSNSNTRRTQGRCKR